MGPINENPFHYNFDTLEEIADKISEVLRCPITIEDINHRLLAYSTHDDITDPARISTIIGRRVPEKVINSLWKEGTIPLLLSTKDPIRVKNIEEVGLGNRVAISIWKNEEVLGFIWALEVNKVLTPEELDMLKNAAVAVRNRLLKRQLRMTKKEEHSQEFFWKLLTGHIHSQDEIARQFGELNIASPHLFSIMLFKCKIEISETALRQISYLLETTQQVKIVLYTMDANELIIMAEPKPSEQPLQDLVRFLDAFKRQLKERFSIDTAIAGIGGVHDSLQDVEKSYKEARAVINVKEKFPNETSSVFTFPELGIYQYLDILAENRKAAGITNYSLNMLRKYDKAHNSNLAETLEVYLDKDSNIHEAAKELNIHANTLSYRLKRIAEIGELNLKSPAQKMTIYLDMKLEKYK